MRDSGPHILLAVFYVLFQSDNSLLVFLPFSYNTPPPRKHVAALQISLAASSK